MPRMSVYSGIRYRVEAVDAYDFRMSVNPAVAGSSGVGKFRLPIDRYTFTGAYDFYVNWGDGVIDHITSGGQAEVTHTYPDNSVRTVTIISATKFGPFSFYAYSGDQAKVLDILKWGNLPLGGYTSIALSSKTGIFTAGERVVGNTSGAAGYVVQALSGGYNMLLRSDADKYFTIGETVQGATSGATGTVGSESDPCEYALSYCTGLTTLSATDSPALMPHSKITHFFSYCTNLVGGVSHFSTIGQAFVTWGIFEGCTSFNGNVGGWDFSNSINMGNIFNVCVLFNNGGSPDINNWNMAKNASIFGMFYNCQVFNQPIGSWNTSNVTDMQYTLQRCFVFNQPIGSWNTSKVTTMRMILNAATAFDQNIGAWDVSKVTDMYGIFGACYVFDNAGSDSIGSWNTGNVTTLEGAFGLCYSFNRNISAWDVRKCATFYWGFTSCFTLKGDFSDWNVKGVAAGGGNQVTSFFLNIDHNKPGGSVELDNLFTDWAANPDIPASKSFTAGTNVRYSFAGDAGRAYLVGTKGWTISGHVTNAVTFDQNSGNLRGTYTTDMGTGTRVRFTSNGTLPTGLTAGVDYWTRRLSASTCFYSTSLANALAGTVISYTDAGTGTHAQARYAWNVTASNSGGKLLFTLASTGSDLNYSGRKVRFASSVSLPTGISAGTDYYVNRTGATTYRVSTTALGAQASTNLVDWTDNGSGDMEIIFQG